MLFTAIFHAAILVLMLGVQFMPKNEIHVPDYVRARLVQINPQSKPVTTPVAQAAPEIPKPEPVVERLREQQQEQEKLRKQEQQKQEKQKQEKLKKEAKEKAAREKANKEKAQKEKAQKEKAERDKVLKDQALKEQALAERRRAEEALARELAAEQARQQQLADIEVAQSYAAMIRDRVERNWSRPPSARQGMEAVLEIQLVPTGYVTAVRVVKSSGNPAFDQSALQAVNKVGRFDEVKDLPSRIFEEQFRKFTLRFHPEDKL